MKTTTLCLLKKVNPAWTKHYQFVTSALVTGKDDRALDKDIMEQDLNGLESKSQGQCSRLV